jgi:Fe-S-cluster-containing dehydrogenase component
MKPETRNQKKAVSRRSFFGKTAALGSLLLSSSAAAMSGGTSGRNRASKTQSLGMLVDLTRCIGCRRCEAACNKANNLPAPDVSFDDKTVFEQKRRLTAESYTVVNRHMDSRRLGEPVYSKVQCMHCEEPACASACLVGALKKTPQGPVVYNEDVCIGCRYCLIACPFYVPTFEYSSALDPRVQKCSMCYARTTKGEVPACAAECPLEAITFGPRDELIKLARDRIRTHPDDYVDHVYGEHELGGTAYLYLSPIPFEELDFPTTLGTTPIPERTRDFLSFVPLVLVAWPALLGGLYLVSRQQADPSGADATNLTTSDDPS